MWWSLTICQMLAMAWRTDADTEVKSLHVTSDIKNRYSTTHVICTVANLAEKPGPVSFYFTYPDTAFITGFAINVNGRELKAAIKKNEDIKDFEKEFGEDIISVFVRNANEFSVLANTEAKAEVIFKLTYEELLSRRLVGYLNILHVNPQQIVQDLKVTVNIEEPTVISLNVSKIQEFNNVFSENSFKRNELAKIEYKSPNSSQMVWAPTTDQQRAINPKGVKGQLVVRYDFDQLMSDQPLLVDEGNYFAHFFSIQALPRLNKHFIFVLDYSYSMEGQKRRAIEIALAMMIANFEFKDFFSIVLVQSYVEVWSPYTLYRRGPDNQSDYDREHMLKSKQFLTQTLSPEFVIQASHANIRLARKYLQEAELGGTFLIGGLRSGLELAKIGANLWKNESYPPVPIITFVSGGQPNIGENGQAAILDQVKTLNHNNVPIYSFALGYYADYDFLHKLSFSNHGVARKIYQNEDAFVQLLFYYMQIFFPLMTNLSFTYLPEKVALDNLTNHKFPVFFKKSEVVVAGRLIVPVTSNDTIGEVTADLNSVNSTFKRNILVGKKISGHTIERSFAFLWVRQLLNERDLLPDGTEKTVVEDKIKELALEYSFLTPLTSLLIEKPDGRKTVVEFTPLNQAPPLDKTELKKISWLQQFLTNETADQVAVTLEGQSYNLALKPSEETFVRCTVNNMAGECHHFQKCILAIFEDNVSDFLPYKCDITGNYLGVCCPFHVI